MAAVLVGGFLWRVEASSRHDISSERIAVDDPSAIPALRGRGLKTKYRADGVDFAGRKTGTRLPGELVIDWYADNGLSFHQEVWKLESPVRAWWKFRSEDPKPKFEREVGKGLVRDVESTHKLRADSHQYFCGNAGKSVEPEFEDCQLWGYWARYGQYLIYLELAGVREPKSSMDSIVQFFDDRIQRE
ncbi:hypothetical protein [Micromonospora fulviviridis]|uniref:hypothetical protein n=1 Tax=Micromonospora fulviviridis TaxID=47860 RepID=UPI0037A6895C